MGLVRVDIKYVETVYGLVTVPHVYNVHVGDQIYLKHKNGIWTVKQFQVTPSGWVNMKVGVQSGGHKDFMCSPLDYKCHRGWPTIR